MSKVDAPETVPQKEISVEIDGVTLRGLEWGDENSENIVYCSHGWMDNCASFIPLMRHLSKAKQLNRYRFVAFDAVGHGQSDHLPPSTSYNFMDFVYFAIEAIKKVAGTKKVVLLGHSMGGAISTVIAGAMPELVERMVLIENLGLLTKESSSFVGTLRTAFATREKLKDTPGRPYPSLEEAVAARVDTAKKYPGKQYILKESARLLVERGSKNDGDGVRFSHDKRLLLPSTHYLDESYSTHLLSSIKCECLLLIGDQGWPFPKELVEARAKAVNDLSIAKVPGSHHMHMDADGSEAVADSVMEFLGKNTFRSSVDYEAKASDTDVEM